MSSSRRHIFRRHDAHLAGGRDSRRRARIAAGEDIRLGAAAQRILAAAAGRRAQAAVLAPRGLSSTYCPQTSRISLLRYWYLLALTVIASVQVRVRLRVRVELGLGLGSTRY